MDLLGIDEKPNGDQSVVYEEFLEQHSRSPEGLYETGLPWKGDHPPLPSHKSGSLKRLGSLVQRLKKTGKLDDYDAVIQEQIEEGIIEEAEMAAVGRELYNLSSVVLLQSPTTNQRAVFFVSTNQRTVFGTRDKKGVEGGEAKRLSIKCSQSESRMVNFERRSVPSSTPKERVKGHVTQEGVSVTTKIHAETGWEKRPFVFKKHLLGLQAGTCGVP